MTEKINVTTENICTERKKFQVPNQTFRVLTLNGVTTVAAYENGNFYFLFEPRHFTLKIYYFSKMAHSNGARTFYFWGLHTLVRYHS